MPGKPFKSIFRKGIHGLASRSPSLRALSSPGVVEFRDLVWRRNYSIDPPFTLLSLRVVVMLGGRRYTGEFPKVHFLPATDRYWDPAGLSNQLQIHRPSRLT